MAFLRLNSVYKLGFGGMGSHDHILINTFLTGYLLSLFMRGQKLIGNYYITLAKLGIR